MALERGAEKSEYPVGVESINSAGVVDLRIYVSVSAMMLKINSIANFLPHAVKYLILMISLWSAKNKLVTILLIHQAFHTYIYIYIYMNAVIFTVQ